MHYYSSLLSRIQLSFPFLSLQSLILQRHPPTSLHASFSSTTSFITQSHSSFEKKIIIILIELYLLGILEILKIVELKKIGLASVLLKNNEGIVRGKETCSHVSHVVPRFSTSCLGHPLRHISVGPNDYPEY